jgi:hypothetical protein
MKSLKQVILLISIALAISPDAWAKWPSEIKNELCMPDTSKSMQSKGICNNIAVNNLPASPLSEEEKQGLQFMREEEKLAHDVYIALGDVWDMPIFKNISRSESVHIEAVLQLLDKYKIADPVQDMKAGEFVNQEFTKLYQKLVNQGKNNLIEALKAGALIEETDITDLEECIKQSDNEDLKQVYTNLLQASHRHLRAFTRNLAFRTVSYTPQKLTQEEYDKIVNAE